MKGFESFLNRILCLDCDNGVPSDPESGPEPDEDED
jgi:hypothetical protein